jgi:hypothetical protein
MAAVDQAKSLMDLVATPSALVTGTFLAFAGKSIKDNAAKVEKVRMWFATLAVIAAIAVTTSLAAVMAPLAYRSILVYTGGVQSTLIVYWLIFLSVVGTACFAGWTLAKCIAELKRPAS